MALHYLELASQAEDARELVLAAQDVMEHNPDAFAEWLRGMQDAMKRLDAIRATFANEALAQQPKNKTLPVKSLNGSLHAAEVVKIKTVRVKRMLAHA